MYVLFFEGEMEENVRVLPPMVEENSETMVMNCRLTLSSSLRFIPSLMLYILLSRAHCLSMGTIFFLQFKGYRWFTFQRAERVVLFVVALLG